MPYLGVVSETPPRLLPPPLHVDLPSATQSLRSGKISSRFSRALYTIIRLDEKGEYSLSLQRHELARLVNFLDAV